MTLTNRRIPIRANLAGLALLASLQWACAQTITPSMAAPPGSINTNLPGFKMLIYQGNSRLPMNSSANAEALLSGKAIDPQTGVPFVNNAVPNPVDGSSEYTIDTYINWHEQALNNPDVAGGNFTPAASSPHNVPEEPVLGIPGDAGDAASGNYFAVEFTGFLQLPAGTVRLGVNSDDGFRLTIGNGINPRDPGALQVAILDGTRGFGNTEVNLTVNQAGLYPFRLTWWDNTGANSGIEFYNFAPGSTSGNRYLINDTRQANAIRAYREAVLTPPLLTQSNPGGSATGVAPAPYMTFEITDGSTILNPTSVKLTVDGASLTLTSAKDGKVTRLAGQAPIMLAGTVHTNQLIYSDSAGTSYTNTWTYTIANYPTIPASYAVASVDTSKPGFRAKIYQIDVNKNPASGQSPNAERQLAGAYINPATGEPYPNTVGTDWMQSDGTVIGQSDASGYFEEPGVLNWNDAAPGATGLFSSSTDPAFEDRPVPGITGNLGPNGSDRYVASIETILQLKAGAYRFGVTSDDGFRLTAGRAPGDVTGIQIAVANADRSATETVGDVVIPVDGFYPFRLMWWDTGGGGSCEFYVVDLATQKRTLINDPDGYTPIKAYRESAASRPFVSRALPTVNYAYAFADEDLIIDITDGAIPLESGSVSVLLNGVPAEVTAAKSGKVTTITRKGAVTNLLPSGANNVTLIYGFTEGGSPVKVTNTWAYTVPPYTRPIPPANKVAVSSVSGAGFNMKIHQIDRSRDANQGNGGRYTGNGGGGANMPRPEIQIANGYINPTNNQPYPNLAQAGTNPDGSFDIAEVLNFNSGSGGAAANSGIFNSDSAVPGLPGGGTSGSTAIGLDNTTAEFITYLNLKAGAHVFGLNVDDGFLISSSPNPRDTLGTLLGFRAAPGGNAGSPLAAAAAFNIIVVEDGIYPIRILWWQGGGGINIEFLAIDRQTGTQILVNDTEGTYPSTVANGGNLISSIKAYSNYTGPVRPWVKFSVYPMPNFSTLWQNTHQQSGPGPILVKVGAGNPADIANDSINQRPFGDAVGAVVADLGSGPVGMIVDGVNVTPVVSDIPNSTDKLVLYTPNPPFASGSTHTAGLVYASTTNYWTFTVITNVSVSADVALPSSAADQNARGFRAKIVQAAVTSTLANTVARAEAQLAGSPANVALPGPEADGAYIVPDAINWSVAKNTGNSGADLGNFTTLLTGDADKPVPGIPGTGLSGAPRFENISGEIFAYLDLPSGYQKFGIDGDDGMQVQIGTPGQTNGPILFTVNRGAGPRDFPIAFITPQAGLYPIRIVWYQGGGGGNLEFFTYGENNQKILVNQQGNPASVKAYYKVTTVTPAKPNLSIVRQSDGTLRITFDGRLQRARSLSQSQWEDESGATSPLTVQPSDTGNFYRAVAP